MYVKYTLYDSSQWESVMFFFCGDFRSDPSHIDQYHGCALAQVRQHVTPHLGTTPRGFWWSSSSRWFFVVGVRVLGVVKISPAAEVGSTKTGGVYILPPKNHWTVRIWGVWMCIAGVLGSPNHQFWDLRILRVVLGCFFFFVLGDGKKLGISTVSVDCKHRSQFRWLFIDELGGKHIYQVIQSDLFIP